MIFHTRQKRVKPVGLKLENTIVERVYEFNFLGLIMNVNLNWKSRVNKILTKFPKVWVFKITLNISFL